MSKRSYEEMCQRKIEINKMREKQEIQIAKRRKIQRYKQRPLSDKFWLHRISYDDLLSISTINENFKSVNPLWCSLPEMVMLSGGIKKFREEVKQKLPVLYKKTLQVKPKARRAIDMVYPLKLHYLHQHPVFYMSNGTNHLDKACILEFRLIADSWWSTTFDAVLINFMGREKSVDHYLLEPLLNTVFTFYKSNTGDWNIYDLSKVETRSQSVKVLVESIGIKGIEWDLFWADLCELTCVLDDTINDWEVAQDGEFTFTECKTFQPRQEKDTPQWIYHYYTHSLTQEKTLIIPKHFRPKNKNKFPKIVSDPFDNTQSQPGLLEALRKKKKSRVMENMIQRMEYLEGCDSLQRNQDFLKPMGQHKEYMLTEILSYLI